MTKLSRQTEPLKSEKHGDSLRSAGWIVGWQLLASLVWILTSDQLFGMLVSDPKTLLHYQTIKGSVYAILISAITFLLVRARVQQLIDARNDQQKIAEEFARSEQWQRLGYEAAELGAWRIDWQRRLFYCDDRAARHFGVSSGVPLQRVFEALHPADHEVAVLTAAAFEARKPVSPVEFRFQNPDGTYRWIAIHSTTAQTASEVEVVGTSRDVTKTKLAQIALESSESLLRAVTENAEVGLVLLDKHRRYTFANASYLRMLGLSGDIIGSQPRDVLPELYSEKSPELDQAFAGERCTVELVQPSNDVPGGMRHFRATYDPSADESGEIQNIIIVLFEITGLRRSEDALRASEERFRGIYDKALTGIVIVDWDGNIQRCNPAFSNLIGYSEKELRNTPYTAITHPGNLASIRQLGLQLQAGQIASFERENRVIHKNGSVVWLRMVVSQLPNQAGRPAEVMAVCLCITARKAAEERQAQLLNDLSRSEIKLRRQKLLFESVFQSAPDPIILTDLDGLIVNVNPAFTRIFHYELDEIAGTSRILYQHASDCDRIMRMGEEHKHISVDELISFVTRSGDKFPGRISSSWLLDDTGRTIGYLRIIRDVSVEERREHELQEKQRLEALGRVTGGIAHDFNNMLAVISGNLQFLGTEYLDGRAKRYLGEAMRAVEMGTRLNKRLLTFAQQRTLAPVPVDLNKLITSLLDLIKHTLEASIKVVVQLDASPAEVRVDESEMENAIINLVLNARDALPDGGIVTIQTFERTPDAAQPGSSDGLRPMRYVYLSVSDNGIGMTEHVKTRAFEPFFTTKAIGAGTGLGLSTIKGFVRQSGGKVSLESEVGKGTTIEIALPACEPTVDTLISDRRPGSVCHSSSEPQR